ncbi:MAG TPA: ATP-binding protein [Bacteroidales bacterium]|nr:ATP-binding protein [Bacteroidales bacterium]
MLLKSIITQIAEQQQIAMRSAPNPFRREALSALHPLQSHAQIIAGIRRCGKSTFMQHYLKINHRGAFFLNFEDPRMSYFDMNDWQRLDEVIADTGKKVLFFDEIQYMPEWERFVRKKLDEKFQVFITGSNASLLHSELGTKLTGRHLDYTLFPFSFREFAKYRKLKPSADSVLDYMETGGFPEFLISGKTEILSQLFSDILMRDVALRYGLRDLKSLQQLALFLISNTGNRITANKLKNTFNISSTVTMIEYLSHLESVFLFFFVPRFSYSLKVQNQNAKKVYTIDTGLIKANTVSFSKDLGNLFENMVFLHLRRKHEHIFYYSEKQECDFVVVEKNHPEFLIQACYELNADNLERETGGLFEAMSYFGLKKGTIVTLNQKDSFKQNGQIINAIPAHEFLSL